MPGAFDVFANTCGGCPGEDDDEEEFMEPNPSASGGLLQRQHQHSRDSVRSKTKLKEIDEKASAEASRYLGAGFLFGMCCCLSKPVLLSM